MKFLPPEMVRTNMIPLNITYYAPQSFKEDDVLTIVYKDLDSGQKLVYDLHNPEIELFVVKPEFRTHERMRDWFEKGKCTCHKVRYRSRWAAAAKLLKLENSNDAKSSPYIFGVDLAIENYYLMQFVKEYPTNADKNLSVGSLDIENDIIQCEGFPSYGEAPINAVTYINQELNEVYTLLLCKDNLPKVQPNSPIYEKIDRMRGKFYSQVEALRSNIDGFVNLCKERFTPLYGEMTYNLLTYDDEETLLRDLMTIIHNTDNDFIGIWNLPYDMGNIIERPKQLGINPVDIICDRRFGTKIISFKEDFNPNTHKRRHTCITSTVPTFVDDMVQYAGIRSGRGKLPSTKLNAIGKAELKDEKYDYSEVSNFKYLFYEDLEKFLLYNIKDVLLMVGIGRKTKDMQNIYARMYQMFVFPKEAFTTTKVVWHSLIKFIDERGYTFGTNRNKGNKTKKLIDYMDILNKNSQYSEICETEEDEDLDFMLYLDTEEENAEEDEDEKFQGAFVMNTLHMKPTGYEIMGKPAKYVHNNVADLDVGSEYPTGINTCNISNETLVGKVFIEDDSDIDIPIPEGFVFRGDDETKYKMDKSNFMMEVYSQGDVLNFCTLFLGLPSADTMIENVKELIKSK